MVTVFKALSEGTELLRDSNIDTPRLDCELILGHVLGYSRLKLLTDRDYVLKEEQYKSYREFLDMRARGVPVSYITGCKEFMGMDFHVESGVLIPRADTEILVETVLEECKHKIGTLRIVDVCCGSGAIGLSIAKYLPKAHVTLIDISDKAVEVSKGNAQNHGMQDSASIIKGDLLSPVLHEKFDIVVSNPPYIETSVIPTLQREVKDYEPHIALDGGDDGLEFFRMITSQAAKCLNACGLLAYEIGYNQAEEVKNILEENDFRDIRVIKDLAGHDRCVTGYR